MLKFLPRELLKKLIGKRLQFICGGHLDKDQNLRHMNCQEILTELGGTIVVRKDTTWWNEVKTIIKKKKKNVILHQRNEQIEKIQLSIRKLKVKVVLCKAKLKAFKEAYRKLDSQ